MLYFLVFITIVGGLTYLGFFPDHAQQHLSFIVATEYWKVYSGVALVSVLLMLTLFSRVYGRAKVLLSELKKAERKNEKQKALVELREQELIDLKSEISKRKKEFTELDRIQKDTNSELQQKIEYITTLRLSLDGFLHESDPLINYVKEIIHKLEKQQQVPEEEINSAFDYIDSLVKYRLVLLNTHELPGAIKRQRRDNPQAGFDAQIKVLDFITTHQHHLQTLVALMDEQVNRVPDTEKSPLCLCMKSTESPYPNQLGLRLHDGVYLYPGISLTLAGFDAYPAEMVGDPVYFTIALRNSFRNALDYITEHHHDNSRLAVVVRNSPEQLIVTIRHRSALSFKDAQRLQNTLATNQEVEGQEDLKSKEDDINQREIRDTGMGLKICRAIAEGFQGSFRFKTSLSETSPIALSLTFKDSSEKLIKMTLKLYRNASDSPSDNAFSWTYWTSLDDEAAVAEDQDLIENRACRLERLPDQICLQAVENIAALSHEETAKWHRTALPECKEISQLMENSAQAWVIFDHNELRDPTWAILLFRDSKGWLCRPEVTIPGTVVSQLKFTHIEEPQEQVEDASKVTPIQKLPSILEGNDF